MTKQGETNPTVAYTWKSCYSDDDDDSDDCYGWKWCCVSEVA